MIAQHHLIILTAPQFEVMDCELAQHVDVPWTAGLWFVLQQVSFLVTDAQDQAPFSSPEALPVCDTGLIYTTCQTSK